MRTFYRLLVNSARATASLGLMVAARAPAITWAPAFASFEDEDLGVLEVGRLADVTVLSSDPLRIPPRELGTLTVTMTIVGGIPVFEAPPLKAP